jgi:transposase-like protein
MRVGHWVLHDEASAYEFVESRAWPDGPVCPHCGEGERVGRLNGASTRVGTYKCYACRQPFTVKIGTVFESSHVPLHTWLRAISLMASSEARLSGHQLSANLGVTVKTARYMMSRIHEALEGLRYNSVADVCQPVVARDSRSSSRGQHPRKPVGDHA